MFLKEQQLAVFLFHAREPNVCINNNPYNTVIYNN